MVKLTDDYRRDARLFKDAGITVPQYDQAAMKAATDAHPVWVHFGGGNLFRCFHAKVAQDLLDSGDLQSGIIVATTHSATIPKTIYAPYENRMLQVIVAPDGSMEKNLIASVAHALYYNRADPFGWFVLRAIFEQPSL
ncbi:Mannitol dehydrogenase domain-containing protein [Schleiferilactobacillus harbinensis DSM 16991]|nr:Mannitol dehydrogenase domain-containing protein [Schleiferilactobacillus harbinensis DSM 16991]